MTPPSPPPDPLALRRRVLLSGAVAVLGYLGLAFAVTASGGPDWLVLPAALLLWLLVVRPLMAPVMAYNKERRAQAKAAFFEQRRREGHRD